MQVTKDDYGEKVIKPFVNLHVTPNDYLLHKAGDLLSYKKGLVFNNHFHHHTHPKPPFHYGPGYGFYKPKPIIHEHPPFVHNHPPFTHNHPPFTHNQPPFVHGHPPIHEPEYIHHSKPFHNDDVYLDHPPSHLLHDKPHSPHFEHYEEPPYGNNGFGGGDYFSRAVNYSDGNLVFKQYQQQYDNGQNYYNNNLNKFKNPNDDDYNSRLDRQLNQIKFPTSRRKRDVKIDEFNSFKTKVCLFVFSITFN